MAVDMGKVFCQKILIAKNINTTCWTKLTNSVSFVFRVRQNRIFPDYQTSDYCLLVRGRFEELNQIEFR